tara:strand:- start:592 stop:1035 length:444 start_codon:yes stop_codon:yes gene_type:complete
MTAAFEQAWAFLKADFSDLSGGEGLGNSRAKMFAQFAENARGDGRDEHAKEMEQEMIDALVGELTEEDLARLFHGQNYDPYMEGTPLQVYRGRRTNNPYGIAPKKIRLDSGTGYSDSGDGEGRFTDFRVLDDAYLNPKGPLGTGEQQ